MKKGRFSATFLNIAKTLQLYAKGVIGLKSVVKKHGETGSFLQSGFSIG